MPLSVDELYAVIDQNPRIRKLTKQHYRDAVDRWVGYASELPSNWTTRRAQAFYNSLIDDGKMKPQSANTLLYGLRYAFRRIAELDRDADLDIMRTVILQRNNDAESARVITEDEAHRLCDIRRPVANQPDGHRARDFAVIVLGLQTGMRRMSLEGIRIENIDRAMIKGVPIKGGKKFDVPLSSTARAAIEPYLRWLRQRDIDSGAFLRSIRPDLMPGKSLSIRGIDELVRRVTEDARVKNVTPHSFRHTFVTWAREAGVQPFEIAAVTGHSSEEYVGGKAGIIQDVYTNRLRVGAKAAERIAKEWMRP